MATHARKVYSGNDVCHAYTYMRYQRVKHFASACNIYAYYQRADFSDGIFGDLLRNFSPEYLDSC